MYWDGIQYKDYRYAANYTKHGRTQKKKRENGGECPKIKDENPRLNKVNVAQSGKLLWGPARSAPLAANAPLVVIQKSGLSSQKGTDRHGFPRTRGGDVAPIGRARGTARVATVFRTPRTCPIISNMHGTLIRRHAMFLRRSRARPVQPRWFVWGSWGRDFAVLSRWGVRGVGSWG